MPNDEWPLVPVGEIARIFDGPHATPKPTESGPIFLGIGNVTEEGRLDLSDIRHIADEDFAQWTRRVTPSEGDVVFSYEASLHRYGLIQRGFHGCLGRRMALVRPQTNRISSLFLLYYFLSPEWRILLTSNILAGATVDRVPLTRFPEFSVRVPPLPIQRRIASILSAYDDLIENHRKRIAILEEMARRLYREWFVHFRYPGHEAVPLVDSPLGRIPQGWEAGKLGKVVNLRWGDTNTTKASYVASGFDAYSASGLDGKLDHFDFDRVGIVLSAIGANCGTTWLARGKWSCIKNTIRYWPIDPRIGIEYLFLVTQGTAYWTRRGAAQPFISQSDAHEAPILIPSIDISSAFSAQAAPLFEMMANLHQQISILRRTRDLLLPRLMSGTLSVEALATAEAAVP